MGAERRCARARRASRVPLVGSGEWTGANPGGNAGACKFSIGNLEQRGLREFGEASTSPSNPFNFAMNSVTGVLDAGNHEISIDCRETAGSILVRDAELAVAALGDG